METLDENTIHILAQFTSDISWANARVESKQNRKIVTKIWNSNHNFMEQDKYFSNFVDIFE